MQLLLQGGRGVCCVTACVLQVKHFEVSDAQKFEEVWRMKEQDVQELLNVLLTADKVIAEQQLGRLWFPPSSAALQNTFEQGKKRCDM